MLSKPPAYTASCMPGETLAVPLYEQIGVVAASGAPDQGGKGNRDTRSSIGQAKPSRWFAGHGPVVMLAPFSDTSVLQSIVLDHASNDGAASDELEDYSTTALLTSSDALGSSSSSCDDVPSATVLESYQDCSSATLQGRLQARPKEEWL